VGAGPSDAVVPSVLSNLGVWRLCLERLVGDILPEGSRGVPDSPESLATIDVKDNPSARILIDVIRGLQPFFVAAPLREARVWLGAAMAAARAVDDQPSFAVLAELMGV